MEDIRGKTNLSREEIGICLGVLRSKAAIEISKDNGLQITMTDNGRKLLQKGFPEEIFLKKDFPISANELKNDEKLIFENLKKEKDWLRSIL